MASDRHWTCLLILLSLFHQYAGEYHCPDRHKLYRDECISQHLGRRLWKDAKGLCESMNASLLTILDQEKNDHFRDSERCTRGCWLDLRRENLNAPWIWQDTGREATFTNWYITQPDNGQEGCVYMDRVWFNSYCGHHMAYICEKQADDSGECDDRSWHPFSGSCYRTMTEEVSWRDARTGCQAVAADLVTIMTPEENDFLISISEGDAWIGLHIDESKRWIWLDENVEAPWLNWMETWPEVPSDDFNDCTYMNEVGTWRTISCERSLMSTCEKAAVTGSACEEVWVYNEDKCYLFVSHPQSWDRAQTNCQAYGADLVVVDSEDIEYFISAFMKNFYEPLSGERRIWVGLRHNGRDGWYWVDGRSLNEVENYGGEMSIYEDRYGANCVGIYTDDSDLGKWASASCKIDSKFICESPNPIDSWIPYNGKFYMFSEYATTWEYARERCKRYDPDADLLVIDGYDEQHFLNALLSGDSSFYWTGMNSRTQRYEFTALDSDDKMEWTNWDSGEPVYQPDELCAVVEVPWFRNSRKARINPTYHSRHKEDTVNAFWDDVTCKDVKSTYCQTPASGEASFFDFSFKSRVYKYVSGRFTEEAGEEYCATHFGVNASLANIRDYNLQDKVERYLRMMDNGLEEFIWFWVDRSSYPDSRCVLANLQMFHRREPGLLVAQHCRHEVDILCEKFIEPSTAISHFSFGRSDYTVMPGKSSKYDAELTCGLEIPGGGKLLDIHSRGELEVISRELILRHHGRELQYWIYGSIDDTFLYNNIDSMPEEGEDCLMLDLPSFPEVSDSDQLLVMPTTCDGVKNFVCEQEYF